MLRPEGGKPSMSASTPPRFSTRWTLWAAAWVASLLVAPAVAATSPGEGAMGFSGYVAVQRLELDALNAQLTDVPALPRDGWGSGYGVTLLGPSGWGFTFVSGTYRWEARDATGLSRLEMSHTQAGVVREVLPGPHLRLTVALLGGLVSAELDLVGDAPTRYDEFTMNRFTRRLVSLQPEVGLLWRLGPTTSLQATASYLLAGDFWHSRWAHPWGSTLEGLPGWFRGPSLRLALGVGGP